jgi:preprotein translocase subunit SecY
MSRLAALFRIPELRKRVLYTLALLAVYRVGIFVTTPGIDPAKTKSHLMGDGSDGGGFLGLFNFMGGGALEQGSIFALGIMPYITSSIIMTMMAVVVPTVERLQKEGEQGRRKINQITRYGTIVISIIQGVMIAQWFKSQGLVNDEWAVAWGGFGFILFTVLSLTAGTAFIMWLGERITERGIGNGISLIIFAGIVARLPQALVGVYEGFMAGRYSSGELMLIAGVVVFVLAAIVFVEKGQRRIPVQYAKRIVGNKQYGGQATHIPLKINVAGVIPPIFASTILSFPATLASVSGMPWLKDVSDFLGRGSWHYQTLFVLLLIFFAFFYTAVQFNPVDVADNLRKFGGFIPGIRPGRPSAEYIDFVLSRITFAGALYLAAVCVLPAVMQNFTANQLTFYFGGTGLLIVVSVALDTVQQIEGHYIAKQYDGITQGTGGRIRARSEVDETSVGSTPSLQA